MEISNSSPPDNAAAVLQQFARFGVDLGLDRIQKLLADLGNPHQTVPIVHVAGTNGKGSVCAYISAVLTAAGYRVGRYTSPHLISWHERICINQQPISEAALRACLQQVLAAIAPDAPTPTQFEVITAAAWVHFAEQKVDIAVMEVGLGGRLDATNVCDRPLVSVITPISREHWQRLGPTVAKIAGEKAGILKQSCPAVIAPQQPEAAQVIANRLKSLNCPAIWIDPARLLDADRLNVSTPLGTVEYAIQLLGDHQRVNSAAAIAALQTLQTQGWKIPDTAIQQGMAAAQWSGRLQWVNWSPSTAAPPLKLLIDGAHNPAAAAALRPYVEQLLREKKFAPPVTWVMGMLATKDHREVFEALLRPGDRLFLVPVLGHQFAEPEALAAIAQTVCPKLSKCQCLADLITALGAIAAEQSTPSERPHLTVLCGSLYMIGDFLRQLEDA